MKKNRAESSHSDEEIDDEVALLNALRVAKIVKRPRKLKFGRPVKDDHARIMAEVELAPERGEQRGEERRRAMRQTRKKPSFVNVFRSSFSDASHVYVRSQTTSYASVRSGSTRFERSPPSSSRASSLARVPPRRAAAAPPTGPFLRRRVLPLRLGRILRRFLLRRVGRRDAPPPPRPRLRRPSPPPPPPEPTERRIRILLHRLGLLGARRGILIVTGGGRGSGGGLVVVFVGGVVLFNRRRGPNGTSAGFLRVAALGALEVRVGVLGLLLARRAHVAALVVEPHPSHLSHEIIGRAGSYAVWHRQYTSHRSRAPRAPP